MADSLVLKGVKDVRRHTGTEMQLTIPKRGGDTHQIKRWWQKGVSTVYSACSVFDVTTDGGTVKLAIASGKGESATVRIDHDGAGNFKFSAINELERAALFTEDFALIEHYIFPAIAGGSIVTVTPLDGADRPAPAAAAAPQPAPAPAAPAAPTESIQDRAANADHTHVVTVKTYYGNEKFYIDNSRQAEVTANAGETIYFDLSDASVSGHPFAIYTDSTKTTTISVGIETSDDGEILLFTPPISGNFSYQCTQHAGMGGDITVS